MIGWGTRKTPFIAASLPDGPGPSCEAPAQSPAVGEYGAGGPRSTAAVTAVWAPVTLARMIRWCPRSLQPPRLSIVIVSWQPGRELVACVESLAAARRLAAFEAELVIVDNASADFPAPAVAAVWPGARLIRNETNRGFGPAANQGVAAATGEVVLLLNPDTEALDDPFTGILEAFAAHPEAVAIAPGLDAPGTEGAEVQGTFQLRAPPNLAAGGSRAAPEQYVAVPSCFSFSYVLCSGAAREPPAARLGGAGAERSPGPPRPPFPAHPGQGRLRRPRDVRRTPRGSP